MKRITDNELYLRSTVDQLRSDREEYIEQLDAARKKNAALNEGWVNERLIWARINDELERKNAALRAALEFYADPVHWAKLDTECDCGDIARDALAKLEVQGKATA